MLDLSNPEKYLKKIIESERNLEDWVLKAERDYAELYSEEKKRKKNKS